MEHATVDSSSDRPRRCNQCGAYGFSDDLYCANCGKDLRGSCANCGSKVRHLLARHCTRCGKSLLLIPLLLMFALLSPEILAQAEEVTRQQVSSGGGVIGSSSHTVRGSVSQTAIGRVLRPSEGNRHEIGFWYRAYRPEYRATVSIPAHEAEVGTRLGIRVELTTGDTEIPFTPRPYRMTLRFNSTLLHPIESTPACSYDGDDCLIEIIDTARTSNGTILELPFLAALGNAEETALEIVSFEWYRRGEERISTRTVNGSFRLLDVCREGGELRLIETHRSARLRVWPNPATTSAQIEFRSSSEGPVSIRVVDLLGNLVATVVDREIEQERLYNVTLPLDGMASGTYTLIYQTPRGSFTERLLVRE